MGSLESGVPVKRTPLLRSSPATNGKSFFHRPRSRLARFLLFEKVDYVQWICTAATFFFVVILFQAFLPVTVVEESGVGTVSEEGNGLFGEIGGLDFGEGIRFQPSKLLERFEKEKRELNLSSFGRPGTRASVVRPKLALVLGDLYVDASHLHMLSIAVVLKEIGYDLEIYALEDGPLRAAWTKAGFSVSIMPQDKLGAAVDWLNYNGVLVNTLEAKPVVSCLSQEPFKSLPLIWSIHEKSLALRLDEYNTTKKTQLMNDWRQAFSRADVVVFPTHLLAMMYSVYDAGNYYVIPGSPVEAGRANSYIGSHDKHEMHERIAQDSEHFLIAIVGSQFSYSGLFLEHALVLRALAPILQKFSSTSDVKIGILTMNSSRAYNMSLEVTGLKFGFPQGSVFSIGLDGDSSSFLSIADVVIYGSFLEEQYFPSILVQAMNLGKLIVAPDLAMIAKHVNDRVNGYLFPKDNIGMLAVVLAEAISDGKLSSSAQNIASSGKQLGANLMALEAVEGYVLLLEKMLKLPSEVSIPKGIGEIPLKLKEEWQWQFFENISKEDSYQSSDLKKFSIVDRLDEYWSSAMESPTSNTITVDEAFLSINWTEERAAELINARKRLLDEELKDRTEQHHGTWEEVYRNVKRAERYKNELHDRDERELERTGQPLCIYEPYFGEGTWPFLHNTSLYRGVGLSSRGRRPGGDDIDASSRLSILNHAYYRDILGEHGAFFALANKIDRVHKNAWIGFQSWRLTARKASLTKKAEGLLVEAIESKRYGDALYFWSRMDKDPRIPATNDFWSFCDAINAGNCRFVTSRALQRMYSMTPDWNSLPTMPADGDTWSVNHGWALPTRSFLELVMFSRMFVDALDSQIYEEHHRSGLCPLSLTKDRYCYSRVLELIVNVWAYHSARRMVYVNPETGAMEEQHKLKSRRGHMWIKWFTFPLLKKMDEDLAEEFDLDHPARRRLWPSTGEMFWQGILERERSKRNQEKERRRRQSKDKIRRIKKRARQKTLGKYIKPGPEEMGDSNTTIVQ